MSVFVCVCISLSACVSAFVGVCVCISVCVSVCMLKYVCADPCIQVCVFSPHMGHALLQLLHPLQGSRLGLCVLQQGPHVEHVVQVGLDLHLQTVALRVLQPLQGRMQRSRVTAG